jgi:hypothetical protein
MKKHRTVLLMLASLVVGALLVPSAVNAAAQLVTIKGAGNNNKARVTGKGALKIDTEANLFQGAIDTNAFTIPAGLFSTIVEGTSTISPPFSVGLVTHVSVDLPSGNGPVTVTLKDNFGIIWQGTVDGSNRHIDAAFENLLIWGQGGLQVEVSGTGAEFTVDGFGFTPGSGTSSKRAAAGARVLESLRSR